MLDPGPLFGKGASGGVVLVQSLHDQHLCGNYFVGFTGGQGLLHPVVAVLQFFLRSCLFRVERVINNIYVPVKSGKRTPYGSGKAVSPFYKPGPSRFLYMMLAHQFVI